MSESIIKCEGLNKWYGSIQALKDVSIDINPGKREQKSFFGLSVSI